MQPSETPDDVMGWKLASDRAEAVEAMPSEASSTRPAHCTGADRGRRRLS